MNKTSQYLFAFLAGALSVAVPTMFNGQWPTGALLPQMVAAGIVGTGLFHLPSPRGDHDDAGPGDAGKD